MKLGMVANVLGKAGASTKDRLMMYQAVSQTVLIYGR